MDAAAHLVNHSISHQLSYGVFDTEYPYRSTELSAKGGHFYWSPNDPEILALSDAEAGQALLERMDFPLVSVAMAYDGFYPLSMEQVIPVVTVLPQFGLLFQRLDELDPRIEWKATRPKQVLMRNATSTRRDYEGKGLMAALARYLMREAAGQGFERINIECLSDAVTHVWANPPAPFKGEVVAGFQTKEYRSKDEDGKETDENPFAPSDQYITRR
ncbi:Hypothetical protein D9617_6g092630 [Elsinoe fawcettii]|nr:Hypothetical protein D9617_6g092630 [Elsinoe fawcettii]